MGAALDLIVPPDRREEAERITQRLARGESIQPFETIRQAKQRGRIPVSVAAFQPDAMLCDIALPGAIDGYAVASAVRRDPALESIYLIALTGFGRVEDRERARRVGFHVHVTKPASAAALRRLLARVPSRARP